ncbi:hypothetical protein ABK040_004708 [Willaertia magna]
MSKINACIAHFDDSFFRKIKAYFNSCDYIQDVKVLDDNLDDQTKFEILSQSSLLLVPPNYTHLSDTVVHYIKSLIDSNRLAIVFFRGIIKLGSLVERLGFLNDVYVDWGRTKTFQMNYKILLQQLTVTKSLYLKKLFDKYGIEIQVFYENVKPEEIIETPEKITLNGPYCTGVKPQNLCQPDDWICFATSYIKQELRYSILIHKYKKVLFSHWYAYVDKNSDFSSDLVHNFIQYVLFDHTQEKLLLKEKLRIRILEDCKLSDIDIIIN